MKKVLVTGGCGFVGRHFVNRLVREGAEITIVDDLSTGIAPPDWLTDGEKVWFHKADVREFLKRQPASEWDTVIHLAAVVGGRLHIENEPLDVATDLSIDAELFRWVSRPKNRDTRVIYFSSSAAYPVSLQTREHHERLREAQLPLVGPWIGRPDFTYGWSKLSGEVLARYAMRYGVKTAVYRPFGGYGEDQSFDYPFPSIVQRVVNNEFPITVWGSGEQCRDFIHIEDIVGAVLATCDKLDADQPMNLGTGRPTSFLALAKITCELMGKRVALVNDPTKPEGVFYRVADPAFMLSRYEPRVTLEEGIKRMIAALDRNPERV